MSKFLPKIAKIKAIPEYILAVPCKSILRVKYKFCNILH